jgi:hypothetical protein
MRNTRFPLNFQSAAAQAPTSGPEQYKPKQTAPAHPTISPAPHAEKRSEKGTRDARGRRDRSNPSAPTPNPPPEPEPRRMVNTFFVFCGCVDQASVAVVEKWGRFVRLAEPGLHFFNPFAGECVAGTLTTRVQSLDVRVETKTKVR